jgi:hypothetical protein
LQRGGGECRRYVLNGVGDPVEVADTELVAKLRQAEGVLQLLVLCMSWLYACACVHKI